MASQEDNDLMKRAHELSERRNISVSRAVAMLEERAAKGSEGGSYSISLQLKPRVARWVDETFGGHPNFTTEERLGAWLAQIITRERANFRASQRDSKKADVTKGAAVTIPAQLFTEGNE